MIASKVWEACLTANVHVHVLFPFYPRHAKPSPGEGGASGFADLLSMASGMLRCMLSLAVCRARKRCLRIPCTR